MYVNGKLAELEQLATDAAKRGAIIRLQTPDGDVVLEPGTANLQAVSLSDMTAQLIAEAVDAPLWQAVRLLLRADPADDAGGLTP